MLYLVGLGLNERGISQDGLEILKKCKKVYLESYTIDLPYSAEKLEKIIKKKIISANREFIESLRFLDEAKKDDVALLIYGSPLFATTHISILQEAKKRKIGLKIIHNASIFNAVGETGLQLYKFGKIASMPNFEADSYIDIVKKNLSIKSHSLILIDIGMDFKNAIGKLTRDSDKNKLKFDKIMVCERLGLKDYRIYYNNIKSLKSLKIRSPFCIIIPSDLHFMEKEILKNFSN